MSHRDVSTVYPAPQNSKTRACCGVIVPENAVNARISVNNTVALGKCCACGGANIVCEHCTMACGGQPRAVGMIQETLGSHEHRAHLSDHPVPHNFELRNYGSRQQIACMPHEQP